MLRAVAHYVGSYKPDLGDRGEGQGDSAVTGFPLWTSWYIIVTRLRVVGVESLCWAVATAGHGSVWAGRAREARFEGSWHCGNYFFILTHHHGWVGRSHLDCFGHRRGFEALSPSCQPSRNLNKFQHACTTDSALIPRFMVLGTVPSYRADSRLSLLLGCVYSLRSPFHCNLETHQSRDEIPQQ